ncbi:MAG: VOC family protein [Candidatus Dormibacteria bacterium]
MVIDHLIVGVSDLKSGTSAVEAALGITAVRGGRHTGRGTANTLIRLGETCYLEVLGPDPEAPELIPGWLSSSLLGRGRLIGWAVRTQGIDSEVERLRDLGWDPGPVEAMSRDNAGGTVSWRLTPSHVEAGVAVLPFLIDWGGSPHPSQSLPREAELEGLTVVSPDPGSVQGALRMMGVEVAVYRGPEPSLRAVIRTGSREVVLETIGPAEGGF